MSIVPPSDYPGRVRLALDALPGTDADRARALGVDRSTILRWRTGEVAPSSDARRTARGRLSSTGRPLDAVMLAARAAEVGP